jgi:cephalosporin hydroxylase
MYQMIVWEVKPDLIIEIGTFKGGGTLYLADLLDIIGKGEIHSIDINNKSDKKIKKHPRIKLFYKGWENYNIKLTKKFKKILVIDDGAHTYEQVRDAMFKFSPLVTKGSYFIVEDGVLTELKTPIKFHGGPARAIKEFLKINKKFTIDRKWTDMFGHNATFNVDGYLKRQ